MQQFASGAQFTRFNGTLVQILNLRSCVSGAPLLKALLNALLYFRVYLLKTLLTYGSTNLRLILLQALVTQGSPYVRLYLLEALLT